MATAEFEIINDQYFRLDSTVWVLKRRPKNIIDYWDGKTYKRVLEIGGQLFLVIISQIDKSPKPKLKIILKSPKIISKSQLTHIRQIIIKIFGLEINLSPFYALTRSEPLIDDIAQHFLGMRPTRYPTLFEALVNAIACQQVSLDAGIAVLNRLITNYGEQFIHQSKIYYLFPQPADLITVSDSDFKKLGFSYQKTKAIRSLAYGIVNGDIDLGSLETMSNQQAKNSLQSFHGIGRWSAEYVLLRGLGRLDIFPGDDVGGQNNLQQILGLDNRPDYEVLNSKITKWHPFEGLIYFLLLLNKLYSKRIIDI